MSGKRLVVQKTSSRSIRSIPSSSGLRPPQARGLGDPKKCGCSEETQTGQGQGVKFPPLFFVCVVAKASLQLLMSQGRVVQSLGLLGESRVPRVEFRVLRVEFLELLAEFLGQLPWVDREQGFPQQSNGWPQRPVDHPKLVLQGFQL